MLATGAAFSKTVLPHLIFLIPEEDADPNLAAIIAPLISQPSLLVSESLDRIQLRRFPRRIVAEEDTHARGKQACDHHDS